MKEIDRTDGDVETLLGRIAAIRTWTYISHRSAWVPDARFWQERTRAVEDRLSDALHERLTQQFVDRPGAVIARYDPSDLVTSVAPDGEVLVQGLRAGVLEGFRFVPRPRRPARARGGSWPPPTAPCAPLADERVAALEADGDPAFRIGPAAEVLWQGAAVGRLARRATVPSRRRVEVLAVGPPRPAASGARAPPPRHLDRGARAQQRSDRWSSLQRAPPAGVARGLVFVLAEGLGSVRRRDVAEQVAALTRADRKALSRLGVTLGRLARLPPRPAPARRRSACGRACSP